MVGCREYGSEYSGVTKFREIIDQQLLMQGGSTCLLGQ